MENKSQNNPHGHEHGEHEHHGDAACGCGHEHHEHGHHEHEHHEHEHHDGAACGCGHEHHEHGHNGDACGCGHEHHEHEHHGDACGCGHEHHEHEHHGDACGCGHEHHEHEHHDGAACGCGHDHDDEHDHSHDEPQAIPLCDTCGKPVDVCQCPPPADYEKKIYTMQNLSCAHCAAQMEERIGQLPDVLNACVIYTTKQLRITAKNPQALLDKIQSICQSIEPDVQVVAHSASRPKAAQSQEHEHDTSGKWTIAGYILSALVIVGGEIYHEASNAPLPWPLAGIFILLYIALGYKVLWTAARNLTRGHVFDENFLMSIATLGALIIGKFGEAAGVMLFYQIGEYFEHRAVERSRSQIMSAIDMRPEVVQKINPATGSTETIPAEDARPGDLLLVRPGDRIPLDGIIAEGESRLDTSPITGEPVPLKISQGDSVISGCVNISGSIKLQVEKALEESMVTRILDSVENAAASKPQLDRFITRFSHYYTPTVIILALIVAIAPPLITGQAWSHWIYTALTFLVMSCPCALVLSVPLAFFSGIGAGSKKGILFKGGSSLEALAHIKAIVMDKTGTLTKGNFKVSQIIVSNDSARNALPAQKGTGTAKNPELDLLYAAACCEMTSTHPIGISILEEARQRGLTPKQPEQMEEIAGHGIHAVLEGKDFLCGNKKLLDKYRVRVPSLNESPGATEIYIAVDGSFAGLIRISDTLKPDAKTAVADLKHMGLSTAILTGDAQTAAQAIAEEAGIDEVHARLLPADKLNHLQDIRSRHGSVMFVGDGINDAPVLAGADVGAAMGSGADAAIEAADVVFMTSDVTSIVDSVNIARAAYRIALQNVIVALIIKVIVMVLGFIGIASMWLAVFADTGVAILCILNSIRILYSKRYK